MSQASDENPTSTPPDVKAVGKEIKEIVKAQQEEMRNQAMDLLFSQDPIIAGDEGIESSNSHLYTRDTLVGEVDSSELLELDEAAGLWPENLPPDDDPQAKNMLFVDQLSCIGCRWCACVARSTFKIDDDAGHGTAKVVQQGGDLPEVIAEAIDVCPADCINSCTRAELKTLEEYRRLYFDDLLASHQASGGAMASNSRGGDGARRFASPHWRDPLVHKSWQQGDRYVKTARLRMTTDDALLHKVDSLASREKARQDSVDL